MIDFLFMNHSKHEIDFMKAQARIFELCNPSGGYRIIVADGTGDDGHRRQLEDLGFEVIPYQKTEIDLDWDWDDSAQHGEGLQIALEHASADIICPQDPDHFWLEREFCAIAKKLMEKYVAVSMGNNLDHGRMFKVIRRKIKYQDDAEKAGKLRRPSGLVSLMGGTFLRRNMLLKNRLGFEHNRNLYKLTLWDEGFLVVNYIEKHHPDEVLWLRPQRVAWDDRPLSFTTVAYLDERPFALHIKGGSIQPGGGFGFADKTKLLRPQLIEYAEALAWQNCRE